MDKLFDKYDRMWREIVHNVLVKNKLHLKSTNTIGKSFLDNGDLTVLSDIFLFHLNAGDIILVQESPASGEEGS